MANTYELIATASAGAGGSSSLDFTVIPSTFTDLCIKFSGRLAAAAHDDFVKVKFNTSSANFSGKIVYGAGSSGTSSFRDTSGYAGTVDASTATTSTFSNMEIYIPNYAGSNYKSFSVDSVQEDNQGQAWITMTAGLWSQSAAINAISIYGGTNLVQYSTAYLYGVKSS
jgi:hypothetical protein